MAGVLRERNEDHTCINVEVPRSGVPLALRRGLSFVLGRNHVFKGTRIGPLRTVASIGNQSSVIVSPGSGSLT